MTSDKPSGMPLKAMSFKASLIWSAVLIAVWEVLLRVIPEGWGLVPVNIGCFVGSGFIAAFGYYPGFRTRMRTPLAWLCTVGLWFGVFVGIRSLF
jgi:hypothetical protein